MDVETARRFGALLKSKRLALGISQRGLAEVVAADFTYLSKIERGHIIPSPELTERLAVELGANPLEFWEAADNTPREVLKAQIACLREDLADFGKHYGSCPVGPYGEGISAGKCDCGLREALENIADVSLTYQGAAYAQETARAALKETR